MRASQTQAPQPLPLPLPLPPPPLSLPSPPAAPRRGRHRTSYSSSSSSSSSVSTASSCFCPSPSPAPSPRASTSVVPFSWERHPGVPKNAVPGGGSGGGLGSPAGTPLPLPPPLQPPPRRRRRHANAKGPASAGTDPFVAAFAECTRDDDGDDVDEADHGAGDVAVKDDKLWLAPSKPAASGSRWWLAGGGGLVGLLDLSGCKSAIAVADGAFVPRRPVAVARSGSSGRTTGRR